MRVSRVFATVLGVAMASGAALAQSQTTLVQVIKQAPTVLAVTPQSSAIPGGSAALIAVKVNETTAGNAPTGTVAFTATSQSGATMTDTVPVSASAAQWVAQLPAGTYAVVAAYSGDLNYLPSTATLGSPITVAPVVSGTPDFSFTMSAASGTVTQGASWNGMATLKSINGFAGNVTLTCGAMTAQMTCSFASGSVALTPSSNPAIAVTVGTMATTVVTVSGIGLLFMLGGGVASRRRRRIDGRVALGALSLVTLIATGCGTSQRYAQTNGTPPGTYAVVVTATSGALVHTQTMQVTVQAQ